MTGARNSIDMQNGFSLTKRNCYSMMRTSESKPQRLNPQTLDLLNRTHTGGFTPSKMLDSHSPNIAKMTSGGMALNADLDDMINLTDTTARPNSRNRNGEKRRHSSTFSTYYLNKHAKELASLVTIEDRNMHDLRDDFILERDMFENND